MHFAQLVILKNKAALTKSRQKCPARYERLFYHSGYIYRYFSDRESFALPEFFLENVLHVEESTLLFHPVGEQLWVAVIFKKDEPMIYYSGPLATVVGESAFDSRDAAVLVAGSESDSLYVAETLGCEVNNIDVVPFDELTLAKFKITSNQSRFFIKAISVVFVVLIFLAWFLWPKEEAVVVANPWESWFAADVYPADINLAEAAALISELLLMPAEYRLNTVELLSTQGMLTAHIQPVVQDNARIKVLSNWFDNKPQLKSHFTNNAFSFGGYKTKRTDLYDADQLAENLHDALVESGADAVKQEISQSPVGADTQYKKVHARWNEVDYGLLTHLSMLSSQQPIFLESLKIDAAPNQIGRVAISISFVVETAK